MRDWDDFVTFYDFRQEHWLQLRTTNPSGVGLRRRPLAYRRRQARPHTRERALLVFNVVQRLGRNWRALNRGPSLMQMVAEGVVFKDGVLQESDQETEVRVA